MSISDGEGCQLDGSGDPGTGATEPRHGAAAGRRDGAGTVTSAAHGASRGKDPGEAGLCYVARYQNLVLSGVARQANKQVPFCLVSGAHDRGFPWGDRESFWDVMLAVGGGGYHRYCITDRVLEGLQLDVARGVYRYQGPIFYVADGHRASFSQMREGAAHLVQCEADFALDLEVRSCKTVSLPFPVVDGLLRRLSPPLARKFYDALPSGQGLGMFITPYAVCARSGTLVIRGPKSGPALPSGELLIDGERTFGQAERSTLCNIRAPTLLYRKTCAVRPDRRTARVEMFAKTLRNEQERWARDLLDTYLGVLVSRTCFADLLLQDGVLRMTKPGRGQVAGDRLFAKQGAPIIEVEQDHFPTAVLQRRIVRVRDPAGEECLALEEDVTCMRLEAVNSHDRVTVAAIRNDRSKIGALDSVLDETGFDALVEERRAATGKARRDFFIVIKPSFMLAPSKRDVTTFTDPELVAHLAKRLHLAGYENIAVVEAQNRYGEYFAGRRVLEVARYLGFDGIAGGYALLDMTEDAVTAQHVGPRLGTCPVSSAWRDADFRISFAKNRTHAQAYYALTLENILGAPALANREHLDTRDVYRAAVEYLTAFPVHFGLVDAYVSADGCFGMFADTRPNHTRTVIGGRDLVAVDWVAASKMGIHPANSDLMRLAVEVFGKPEIHFVGDANPYQPWRNVPVALNLFSHKGLDADDHAGNLFYMGCAQMDTSYFKARRASLLPRIMRNVTAALRRRIFVRTGKDPWPGNRVVSWVVYKMGY